jgi:DNA-binding beta-propeller fold protein YncE
LNQTTLVKRKSMLSNRKKIGAVVSLLVFILVFSVKAQQSAPASLIQTTELPADVKGHFDHFGVDLSNGHLFATPEDYKALLVFDTSTGKLIHTIGGIERPHAVLYRQDLNRIYVTDGGAGELKVYDGKSFSLVGEVKLLKDADSIGYDPETKYLYIDNGGKDVGQPNSMLSIVDTTACRKIADLSIDGETLEAMALDHYRPRLYVNNKAKNHITVVNRWKRSIVTEWPVTLGSGNVAMALDEPHQRLFVGCRSGHIVVFDTNTGKELQALPIAKGVDDIVYDAASKRLYAACDGSVVVYEETDADHFKNLSPIATSPSAKTARLVPELHRYYVAAPAGGGKPAQILAFGVPPPSQPLEPTPTAEQINAPFAETLVLETLSANPDLRKMGLHTVPPGEHDSVIIANGNLDRLGRKSSAGDLAVLSSGKTYCKRIDDGSFYNMKLPIRDASGRPIGLLVMEIPLTSEGNEAEAVTRAESIRDGLQRQIPNQHRLFQN